MKIELMLSQHAKGVLKQTRLSILRGVTAFWNKKTDTLILTYFLNKRPSEDECDVLSEISTNILAGLPICFLEEEFIILENTKPLPESRYWVYQL